MHSLSPANYITGVLCFSLGLRQNFPAAVAQVAAIINAHPPAEQKVLRDKTYKGYANYSFTSTAVQTFCVQ